MKKRSMAPFLTGLTAGVLIAANWRKIAKEGIKFGIVAGRKLNEVSAEALEDLQDLTAEAVEELGEKGPSRE